MIPSLPGALTVPTTLKAHSCLTILVGACLVLLAPQESRGEDPRPDGNPAGDDILREARWRQRAADFWAVCRVAAAERQA